MKNEALESIDKAIQKYNDLLFRYNGTSISATANHILCDLRDLRKIVEKI